MNTPDELHAFVIGLCEILAPWPARYWTFGARLKEIEDEHHYYMFGRAMGVIAWLIIAKIIQEVFW